MFNYSVAQSLADSTNAYEACFWRMMDDTNYSAAKDWANKIINLNPKSVPGWWLKYTSSVALNDTVTPKKYLDSALVFLNNNLDPAMPDSTKGPLEPAEKNYLTFCHFYLKYYRSLYGQ